jgi:hypothetical protein
VEHEWNSAPVIVKLVLGGLLVLAFLAYEYMMNSGHALAQRLSFQKPMLPWTILRNRNISLLFLVNFATGMAMYSVSPLCRVLGLMTLSIGTYD